MSAHGDFFQQAESGGNRESDGSDSAQSAFRFEIDGREFVALDKRTWRKARRTSDAAPETAIGRIATPSGQYLIFRDEHHAAPVEPGPADMLSRRELQVAMLVSDGRCDKEIARQLGISAYTVREHIRRIFAKLGVSRRSAIIARMLRR